MEINYGWINSTTVKRSLVVGGEAALVAMIVSALVNPLLASAWLTQVYTKLMLQANRPESRGVYSSPHTSKVMDAETNDVDDDDDNDDDDSDDVRPIDSNKIGAKNGAGEENANPEDEEEANEDNVDDDDTDGNDDEEEDDEDDDDEDGEDDEEDEEEDEEDEEEALQPPKKRKK